MEDACDAAAVGQLRWLQPVPFIHPAHEDVQPCSAAKLAHAQNNPFNSWMLTLSFQGLRIGMFFCVSQGLCRQLQGGGWRSGRALVFQVPLKLRWFVTHQKQRLEGKGAGTGKSLGNGELNNSG